MVALFAFPSKYVYRFLHRRKAARRPRKTASEEDNIQPAQDFIVCTAQQLATQQQQLSTSDFLDLRQFLAAIPFAREFSSDRPNDVAEWMETLFTLLNVPSFLTFSPNSQSYVANIGISPKQSVQAALDFHLAQNQLELVQTPPLLIINLQRWMKKTRSGGFISQNYRIEPSEELQLAVRTREQKYKLQAAIVMNRERNHYSTYFRHHNHWYFFSDIGGEFQALPANFRLNRTSTSRHYISLACNSHLLIYAPD